MTLVGACTSQIPSRSSLLSASLLHQKSGIDQILPCARATALAGIVLKSGEIQQKQKRLTTPEGLRSRTRMQRLHVESKEPCPKFSMCLYESVPPREPRSRIRKQRPQVQTRQPYPRAGTNSQDHGAVPECRDQKSKPWSRTRKQRPIVKTMEPCPKAETDS